MNFELVEALAQRAGFTMSGDVIPQGYYVPDDYFKTFVELVIRQCGYYADIFDSLGCPGDMDPTDTKPSDYINKQFGVEE